MISLKKIFSDNTMLYFCADMKIDKELFDMAIHLIITRGDSFPENLAYIDTKDKELYVG